MDFSWSNGRWCTAAAPSSATTLWWRRFPSFCPSWFREYVWSTIIIYCNEGETSRGLRARQLTLWNERMNDRVLKQAMYFLPAEAWRLRITRELFQRQNGFDDDDSQGLWRPSLGGIGPGGRADGKVSNSCFLLMIAFVKFSPSGVSWSIRTRRKGCSRPSQTTVLRDAASKPATASTFSSESYIDWCTDMIGRWIWCDETTYSWTPLPVLFAVTLSSSSPVSSPWRRCTSARRLPTLFSTTSPRLRSLPKIFSGYFGCPVGIVNSLPGVPQSIRSQNQHRDAALLFHRVWHVHTGSYPILIWKRLWEQELILLNTESKEDLQRQQREEELEQSEYRASRRTEDHGSGITFSACGCAKLRLSISSIEHRRCVATGRSVEWNGEQVPESDRDVP